MGYLDGWRFCPRCAAGLERSGDHLRCPDCGERYWANPVPGTQAVITRNGRVLLGRRRFDPGVGRWDLPGGFLHEGEDALDGLRREVREETALEIEPLVFLGTWKEPYLNRDVLCLTWLAAAADGEERPGDDPVELRWFAPSDPAPRSRARVPHVRDDPHALGGGLWEASVAKIGRPAQATVRSSDDYRGMDEGTLHRIEDDLRPSWVEEWAEHGIGEIEAYLAKHLAFLTFLDESA